MKKLSEISKRYARAAFGVSQETSHSGVFLEGIRSFSDLLQGSEEIAHYFHSPTISAAEKIQTIRVAVSGNMVEELASFLLLLVEKNRLQLIGEIVEAFEALLDEANGVTRGFVRSARDLDKAKISDLETRIGKILNKKVVLTFQKDPSLLGGAVASVAGWTFDDGIENHIQRLNEELNRRTH